MQGMQKLLKMNKTNWTWFKKMTITKYETIYAI